MRWDSPINAQTAANVPRLAIRRYIYGVRKAISFGRLRVPPPKSDRLVNMLNVPPPKSDRLVKHAKRTAAQATLGTVSLRGESLQTILNLSTSGHWCKATVRALQT